MIATIILAAGLGRRLGMGVKALVKVGDKTLLQHLVEKSGNYVVVLTSDATHDAIAESVKRNGWKQVHLVKMPSVNGVPIGNGALYQAMVSSEIFQKWLHEGLTHLSVVPIDNPLADPLDPEMTGDDLVVKAIKKSHPEEKLGAISYDKEQNKIKIFEYFELTPEQKKNLSLGYTGMFMATVNFFIDASKIALPWHEVIREGKSHQEKFLFDAFFLAKTPHLVIQERNECFCPIKVKSDIALAEKLMYNSGKLK